MEANIKNLQEMYPTTKMLTMAALRNSQQHLQILKDYYEDLIKVMSDTSDEYDYKSISKSGLGFVFEINSKFEHNVNGVKNVKDLIDFSLSTQFKAVFEHFTEENYKDFKTKMEKLNNIIHQIDSNNLDIEKYLERIRYLLVLLITSNYNQKNFNLEQVLENFESDNLKI